MNTELNKSDSIMEIVIELNETCWYSIASFHSWVSISACLLISYIRIYLRFSVSERLAFAQSSVNARSSS
jgi:hypothetical protein